MIDQFLARQDPQIKINCAESQEHVTRAQKNNHFIQENIQAEYHRLPFTHLPRFFVKYIVMESTNKLKFFSNKYCASKYFSPRMIILKENLDWERHFKYQIGEYVLAHDDPDRTNTNAPPLSDFIYL